jgi:hypothetical protein
MQLSSPRLFSTRTAMSVTILSSEAVRAAADISLPPAHTAVFSIYQKNKKNKKNKTPQNNYYKEKQEIERVHIEMKYETREG